MPQPIDIEGFGTVEFPDDASPEQIKQALDTYVTPRVRATFTDRADRIERGRQAEGYEPPSAIRSAAESIGGAIAQLPSRLGRDLPIDLAKTAVAVPQGIVGLANIPTGGRAGRLVEDLGVDFKTTQSYFDSLQSAERQVETQRIQEAEGLKDTALAIAQSPGTVFGVVAQSLGPMGLGAALGQRAMAAAPRLGALGAALSKVPAPALGEGLVAAGSAAEQIRQQTPDRLLTPTQSALAAATGVATGAFGVLGGKAAAKLKIDDVDAILSGALPVNQKGNALVSVLKGALTEGVLEELPQSVSEQFFQNVALGRPRDEALAEAAVLGLLSGSLTGGALQPYLINEARRTKAAQDLLTQRQQVQDNLAKIRDDAEKLRQRSGALPPTLPASPTPSAPTTATRGPTGAPAPTVDAPLAGESPLPPAAPALPPPFKSRELPQVLDARELGGTPQEAAEALGAIFSRSFPDAAPPDLTALRYAIEDGQVLASVQDGKPTGYSLLDTFVSPRNRKPQGVLKWLITDPSSRGTGSGQALMDASAKWFSRQGISSARIEPSFGSAPFYNRYFQTAGFSGRPFVDIEVSKWLGRVAPRGAAKPPTPAAPKPPPPSGSALKATLDLAFAEMDAAEQKELDDLRAKRDSGKILTANERRSLQDLEERRARDAAEAAAAAQPPTPTPAPQPRVTTLPAELSKAKPRYSYGEKKFLPTFASDIDLALYTVAQKTTSKRDADYLKFLVDSLGLPEKEVRALGTRFRDDVIKPLAARAEGGTAAKPAPLSIPPFYSAKPPTPAPNAPAAVRQQPGVPVQPAQAPQGGVSPKAGAGDSAVGAKAKPAAKEAAVADELDRLETIESVGQLSAKQTKRLAELRAKAAAQPAPAQPAPAQPAPAQPAPAAGAPRPLTPSEATFQAALSRMTQESAQTFQHLWDTAVQSPGGSVQSTLARMAEEVASGALQAKLEGIASVLGIDNVGPLQVLPVGDPDLTRWGDNANQKTGGFVVRGGQVFLDPYGYFADLFGNPVLQAKTIAHELWHVVTARVITRMVQARAQEQGLTLEAAVASVYQELFAALPRDFVSAARKTAWGDSQVVAVEEYIRAALEKFGAPRIAKFSDLTDANVRKALSGAAVTEELSQREGEEVREALVKAMLSLDLSGISSLKGKGIVERVRNFLSTMANLFRNEPGTVPPLVIQVIDESLKAVTGVKPAAVKVKPAAVKVKAVAAETPRGGGRMKEGADVGAIRESRSSARLTTAMAAITQSLAERPESFRTSFEAAFSQIVGEEGLPTEGLSADYFYTELAKQLAKIPLTAEKVPDRFVSNLRRSKETKGRVRTPQKTPVETAPPLAIAAAPGLVGQPALGFQIAATYELITALPTLSGEQRTRVQDLITRMADPAFELTPQAVSSALGRPVSEAGVNAETGVPFGVSPAAQNFARLLQVLQDNPNDPGAEIAVARVIRETGVPPEYLRPALQHLLALRQASQGEAIPAQASVTTEEAEDMQEFQDVAGERRKALPATSSYGFWVSPTGELIPTSYHPATAAEIMGDSATPEQLADVRVLYQMMQERGYLRMVREAADDYTVDLLVDQRPNSAQRAALENFGINQEKNITLLRGNRGELFYSVPEAPSWLDRVFGDRRKALPATQGDEDLGAAETRLRGAFIRILDQVLLPARERDEDLYTNTLYQAARTRLDPLLQRVNAYLASINADPVTLASDDFEAVVNSPAFRSGISALPISSQLDSLMQDRANVLQEQGAQQVARELVRLEDTQALLEFWQTVDQEAPGVAAIVKRLEGKLARLQGAIDKARPELMDRARQIKLAQDTKIDRVAAARAQSGPLLEWLRGAGSTEVISEILEQEPFSEAAIRAAQDPRLTAAVGANAPGMSVPAEGGTPNLGPVPAYSLGALISKAINLASSKAMALRELLDGFDRQRQAANAALASKDAQALARDILQLSQDIKQAQASLGQGQLDLKAVLSTVDGATNRNASMALTVEEQQQVAAQSDAAERAATNLVSLIQENKEPILVGQLLDFLTRPSQEAATQTGNIELITSVSKLASDLGVSSETLQLLLRAMAKSNPLREAFSALVDRKLGVPLVTQLERLESSTKAFNEAAEKFRTTPVTEETRAEFQAALAARDAAVNSVVAPLRHRLQSQGAQLRGLENRLMTKLIQQRTLQLTAEAFEAIASDPEFNQARFGIERETAEEFSLQQLVRWDKARGGYQFSAFGLVDPKTGQRVKDDLGSDGFFWSPSDPFSTSRDQVLDYMRKAQNLLDLNAAATLAYETDPTANPSPAQLGFDARMMTALQLMMDHDATERLVTMELLDPELAKGSVGFMESWWLSRWIWRAWINTRGILGGRGLAVLEAFAYALPGRIGPVLRQSMGKFDRLAADLNGVFAEAQRPKDSKDPGLGRTLRKAMASHGADSYSVPAFPDGNGGFVPLSVEMYREKVFNYLMSRGRTSGKFDVSVGADIPLSGGMKVTQEDLDLLEAASKLNRNVYGLLGRSGRADRFIIEGKFSRKPQANWRYYSNRRLASRRVNGFLDRVAAVEKKTPGVSLAKGDAAAVDFWSAADNFDLVLSHIVDALSDPAEDAVVHRPGVRAAMAEAAPTIESATNLTEVVAQLTNTAAAKKAGLSSDQLRAALNEELDQLFNNAKAMFTAKQSGELSDELTLDATRRVSVSADNQFTTPFGPRKLPSRLYDYGALTQPELAQFQRNASKLEMIDLINALQFAVTELRTLKLKYREGDPAAVREFKARFTDEGEVDHLINQGEQLQDTLLTYGANGGSGKVGWLISRLHTAALLGKPIVMLFNAQTAPIMFAEQLRKIDVGGFMKPRRRAAELLGRTNVALGRSVAAYTAGKLAEVVADVAEKAGVKRANLPGLIHLGIKLVDRERMMRSNVAGAGGTDRLGFWTEFYRAIDALQVEGMGAEIPERYRSWEEWLRRKAIDPLSATGSALLKKLNTGSGDLRINASIMVMMDWLGETYAGVAERYLNRLQAEGKLDLKTVKGGQEVLLRPGINVAQLAVKPSDFGDSLGNVSNQAKLQRLRQWLQRAGFPSPEQMFLDYHARRQADINASIFTTDQLRMLMQTMVSDTNAPTLSNRPMAFFTDGNTAELFKLMGYGFNAIFQAANAPVRVRRTMDQPAERYAKGRVILDPQQLYWLAGSAITLALFGSLADGLRELWRRHIQNRGRSRDTIFDADVYTDPRRVGRMVLRSGAAVTPFPYISDALNVLLEADPFGRGFDPSSRPVIASLVTLLIGESVSAWTALKPVLSGEFGEAATRLGRQATRLGMTFVPWGAEAAGQLARAGVALEGPVRMMQQNAAAQQAASLQPGMLKPGGIVASAKSATTPSPFRDPIRMMLEAQVEKNPAKYQEAMGYFVRALQEKNVERVKRGQEPISLEEQLRASSEGYVPFKYLAPGATQTEIASAMAQAPEASRQAILERQAMVSNIRGGEEVRLGVQPRGQAAGGGGGGGGGGGALPTSSLRLPGIGRVSVGGGGGGGGSRLSRSRRRRPRLTLGGRGRNLSRLRVRRLRSPRNRLLRRRRA